MSTNTWFASVILSGPEEASLAEGLLSDSACAVIIREYQCGPLWELLLQFDAEPDQEKIRAVLGSISDLRNYKLVVKVDMNPNWVETYRRNTQPLKAGQFFIYPSHFDGQIPRNLMPIQMDAGLAFGTGDHPTTIGCLLALKKLALEKFIPDRVIDLGCGTGILAIAVRRLWPKARVIATDIDPVAVETAHQNMEQNRVRDKVELRVLNGWPEDEIFDLCIANILSGPLISLAPVAAVGLSQEGRALLSGILSSQTHEVSTAWHQVGFRTKNVLDKEGWMTIDFSRR